MRIKIINPNTTAAFTARVRAAAERIAAPGTHVLAGNPAEGAASIESHAEEALGARGVMDQVQAGERDGINGYVIACFGDTGVHAAREIARGPVVGMTEAALYAAAALAHRFTIVTLPPRTRAHALRVLCETGLGHRCTVRAIHVAVLDLEHEAEAIFPVLLAEAGLALEADHAEALILDGVLGGLKLAEGLVAAGLRTSKRSTYAAPPSGWDLARGGRR